MDNRNTIVEGEASESDEEDSGPVVKPSITPQVVVKGEASEESEDENEENKPATSKKMELPPLKVDQNSHGDVETATPTTPTRVRLDSDRDRPKYDTLLHNKLREKNVAFRSGLCDTVGQLYLSSAKEFHNITQQLIKSQAAIQDVSHNMRLLTNDLFHLEDKIDIIATCSILPDITIDPTQHSSGASTPTTPTEIASNT